VETSALFALCSSQFPAGEKIFTLFPPSSHHDMYLFPRLHPLWHKSQVRCLLNAKYFLEQIPIFFQAHFDAPNLDLFPNYKRAKAYTAHLFPGDVLYIPPYWWHHVQSVTASGSLLSRCSLLTANTDDCA
jgi:hypoxia-inducible factor 1-alpha inhibitor (HIF hydroxylase)